ncbi:MAG: hypothetical protein JST86_11595 [Bacteroidetes bacterium]|nr:hypothetical protein [Bacteroidota bacterium]
MKPLLLLSLTAWCACNTRPAAHKKNNTVQQDTHAAVSRNYDSCKNAVLLLKQQYKNKWLRLTVAEKQKIFTNAVTGTIIPCWMGTPWSFNGTTETPPQGSIACGYFVTTVLRDAGVPLARIKLAQCPSEQMIKTLVQPRYITHFSNSSMPVFMAAVRQQGYGMYIVGLDNHTGFIYNNGQHIYFIHASYIGERKVTKELAAESSILYYSKYKVLGKISGDEQVLQKWIN